MLKPSGLFPEIQRRSWLKWLLAVLGTATLVGLITFLAVRSYIIERADANIHNILMSHRGLHEYIQRDMHPTFYAAIASGQVLDNFYDPRILSSSYIVRVMHGYYNAEREKDGRPSVYYKMASINPRNPLNQADAEETRLIQHFNQDRAATKFRQVIKKDGQTYLLHAIPFMENTKACLHCHGRREDAPPGLQALYPGQGGFNEQVGVIRAVEIIRAPLHREIYGAAIATASLMAALLAVAALFVFNAFLRSEVRIRTSSLEAEVQERSRAEAEVLVAQQRLSEAVQLARLGHWRYDLATHLFTFTDEFYAMLRTNAAAMGGYTMSPERYASQFLPSDDQAQVAGEIQKAVESKDLSYHGQLEHRLIFPDGEIGYVLVRYHLEIDAEGNRIGLTGVNQDITERKHAEDEIRNAKLQLIQAQKMESLGLLAGGVAHDMNNVLGAILGLASVLKVRSGDPEDISRSSDTIIKACDRGKVLVRGLLNFARRGLEDWQVLDVNSLIREEVELLKRTTLQKVTLIQDLDAGLGALKGDRGALSSALLNLCVNAVDAMNEGGTLTLRSRNEGNDWICLEVSDTGSGMPVDVLERAMEPFFTTKPQGKGTGLGLAMVYGTVQAHKGTIELESVPGQGTTVRLRFPAHKMEPSVVRGEPDAALVPLPKPMKILVVDDDELIRAATQAMLAMLGMEALLAESGEAALEQLANGLNPDLVILDLNMPGIGGKGTLPGLRQWSETVPVLLATGRADQNALDLVASDTNLHLLAKPYGLAELRAFLVALSRQS